MEITINLCSIIIGINPENTMTKSRKSNRRPPLYSLRLLIAIPIVFFLTTFIVGISFYILAYHQFLSRPTFEMAHIELFLEKWRILFGGLLLLSFIMGIVLSYYILSPLRNITKSFRDFLEGKEMRPLNLQSKDELGELSSSYNSIVHYLSQNTLSREAVLNSLGAGILFLNHSLEITFMNQSARRILKYKGALPLSMNRLLPLTENSKLYYHLGQGKSDAIVEEEEAEVVLADGTRVLIKYSISRFKKENQEKGKGELILTFKDVLHFENIQKRILQAEQLAIVGGLSAGIAHEVKNPLGSVRALIQLLLEDLQEEGVEAQFEDYFERIFGEIQRLDRVINNVLFFSQIKDLNLKKFDINSLARNIVRDCQNQYLDKSIKVFYNLSPHVHIFWGDENKLYQAFMNIVKNAFEMMSDHQVFSVKTQSKEVKPNITPHSFILKNSDLKSSLECKGGVEIIISNTGTEIDHAIQDKIFNPFFTTEDCGSGLGLAIAKQVIDAHCGYIDVQSNEKRTSFIIRLPLFSLEGEGI